MKIVIICNADALAFPTIQALLSKGLLGGIVILKRSSKVLLGSLLALGVSDEMVLQLSNTLWYPEMKNWLSKIRPDAVWVFGFPWFIPDDFLRSTVKGFINFHFGKLPQYRGADPIFWQLKNDESHATLTVHQMTRQIDAGPVLWIKELPIIKGENYGLLCQRLGFLATEAISDLLEEKNLTAIKQEEVVEEMLWEKKPGSKLLTINWISHSADEIECLINASNPKYGGATAWIKDSEVRILEVAPAEIQLREGFKPDPGTIVYADALYGLIVACKENRFLKINTVHMREGYFSGTKLFQMGIQTGEKFTNLN